MSRMILCLPAVALLALVGCSSGKDKTIKLPNATVTPTNNAAVTPSTSAAPTLKNAQILKNNGQVKAGGSSSVRMIDARPGKSLKPGDVGTPIPSTVTIGGAKILSGKDTPSAFQTP